MPTIGSYRFSETDVLRTMSNLGAWWDHVLGGIDSPTASAVADGLARQLEAALGVPSGSGPVVDRLGALGIEASKRFAGSVSGAESMAVLGTIWDSMSTVFAQLRRTGTVATTGRGTVARINVSSGGVPKRPIDAVDVDFGGVVGDRQGSRSHHGRPWQALCLWSTEVIDAFAAAGHPIGTGSAGENLSLTGVRWADVRPGVRMRIGTVVAEMTAWAIPCRHNAPWFSDGDFNHMSHERGPVSRIYATVIEPGRVATGDRVELTT